MRWRFTLFLLVVAAAGMAAYFMQQDPGYVLIAYNGNSIEMTLWLAIVALVSVLFALYLLVKLPRWIMKPFRAVGGFMGGRREKEGRDGMVAYLEGDYQKAQRLLEHSAKYSLEPVVPYVMAARSSEKLGQPEKTDMFLRLAGHVESQPFLTRLSQADILAQRGDYQAAAEILDQLAEKNSSHPHLSALRIQVNKALGREGELLPQLKQLRKRLPGEEFRALEIQTVASHLQSYSGKDEAEIEAAWNALQKRQKLYPELVLVYASLMTKASLEKQANVTKTIKALLKKQWSDACVEAFGRLKTNMAAKNLKLAEQWLLSKPENPVILVAIARLSLQNQLWGQAKKNFEAAVKIRPSAEIYAELARLCERLGEDAQANHYKQLAITSSVSSLPDLPLPN